VGDPVIGPDHYPTLALPGDASGYYQQHGYIVFRGLVDAAACERLLAAFRREVKSSRDLLLERTREDARVGPAIAKPMFTESGFLRGPISNFHTQDPRRFPDFHRCGLAVLADPHLHRAVRLLLGEEAIVVESLYYEGNPKTWAHQDAWYFDSQPPGRMIGCWIALEPIAPGAGRFFVYPGSHRLDMRGYGVPFDVAVDSKPYERLVLDVVRKEALPCRVPALETGDVVFWNGGTIHGTLETSEPGLSRSSLNLHLVPASGGFCRFSVYQEALAPEVLLGVKVHAPSPPAAPAAAIGRVTNVTQELLSRGGPRLLEWAENAAGRGARGPGPHD
jgi:phytanoyl-CoA hydroxylase